MIHAPRAIGWTAIGWPVVVLVALHSPLWGQRDSDLAQRVRDAIERGTDALEHNIETNGWLEQGELSEQSPVGAVAISVAALCRSGDGWNSSLTREGIDTLRRLPSADARTFDLATAILALEAPYVRRRVVVRGREFLVRYSRGKVPPDDRQRIATMAARLIDEMQDGAWGQDSTYTPDPWSTQLAVHALNVARRVGIRVPAEVWRAIVERQLRDQQREGPKVEFTFTRRSPSGRDVQQTSEASARAWVHGVKLGGSRSTALFSTTASSLSSLVVARDGLASWRLVDRALEQRIDESLRDGLAFLALHWDDEYLAVDENDTFSSLAKQLYAFETLGESSDIVRVNGHDWYVEGAKRLLELQGDDGAWGERFEESGYALLFLNRATLSREVRAPEVGIVAWGREAAAEDDDLVYVRHLDALVSGVEALAVYADAESRHNHRCARAVVEGYPRHRLPRLIPTLLRLAERGGKRADLATPLLQEIGGRGWNVSTLEAWFGRWDRLHALEIRDDGEASESAIVAEEFRLETPALVVDQALRTAEERGFKELAREIFPLFDHTSVEIQVRVRDTLARLTGLDLPYEPDATGEERESQVRAWWDALARAK